MVRFCAASMDSVVTHVDGVEGGVPGTVPGVAEMDGGMEGAVDAFVAMAELGALVPGVELLVFFLPAMKVMRWGSLCRETRALGLRETLLSSCSA